MTGVLIYCAGTALFLSSPLICGLVVGALCITEIVIMSRKGDSIIAGLAIIYVITASLCYREMYLISKEHAFYGVMISAFSDMMSYLIGSSIAAAYRSYKNNKDHLTYKLLSVAAYRPFRISPQKTVAGFITSFLSGSLTLLWWKAATIILSNFNITIRQPFSLIPSMFLGVMGQVGDLVESSLKRRFKRKDSGKLLGSHGGICDRVDSMYGVFIASYILLHFRIISS